MIGHHIHGHGPAHAIVLSGWIGDWQVFRPMLDALDPDRLTLAFMDNRGYGLSRDLAGPRDIATVAADAARLAEHLGWSSFSVIGHSMGGKAALRLAVDQPDRVRRILAITPVWAGKAPLNDELVAVCRNSAHDAVLRALLVDVTTGRELPQSWARLVAERSMQCCDMAAYAAYFEAWSAEDFVAEAAGLPHEVLVLAGERDAGLSIDDIRAGWLENLPRARLRQLPGCGHYPMCEMPLGLARIVEDFIAAP